MSRDNFTVTYYDFANIYYASFFLTGFMENARLLNYRFVVSKEVPAVLKNQAASADGAKILFNMCLFKMSLPQEEVYFCIDTRDQNSMKGMGYHLPLLEKVKFYFKVNYNLDEIRKDETLRQFQHKIVPVPLFFPLKMPCLIDFRPRMLPSRTLNWSLLDMKRRIRALYDLPSAAEMMQYRQTPRDLDVFFVTTYYEQKHHAPEMEYRYAIMKEIKKLPGINSVVGFTDSPRLPEKYRDFACAQSDTRNYLKNVAKSKVAIYVRGLHSCLSFKLGQLLWMGLPIVGQSIANNAEMLYGNPYFREQFACEDPETIVQRAVELLARPDIMAKYGRSNAELMDSRYTPGRITADIISMMRPQG